MKTAEGRQARRAVTAALWLIPESEPRARYDAALASRPIIASPMASEEATTLVALTDPTFRALRDSVRVIAAANGLAPFPADDIVHAFAQRTFELPASVRPKTWALWQAATGEDRGRLERARTAVDDLLQIQEAEVAAIESDLAQPVDDAEVAFPPLDANDLDAARTKLRETVALARWLDAAIHLLEALGLDAVARIFHTGLTGLRQLAADQRRTIRRVARWCRRHRRRHPPPRSRPATDVFCRAGLIDLPPPVASRSVFVTREAVTAL